MIVNPKSASGSTDERWAGIASDLRTHFGPFLVEFTRAGGDAVRLAEEASRAGHKFVIACGGDGTINEVANGILSSGRDVELGVLPSGTGGDFRRTLKLPSSTAEAAKMLRSGRTKQIDVGKVTFLDPHGSETHRYFVNVSSVGLAPHIVDRVKSTPAFDWLPSTSLRGRANFAVSTLQEVLNLEPDIVRVRFDDGDEHQLQTIAFCIANSRYFGGGMMIAPKAKINDGLFDVVNIGDLSTAQALLNALSIYRGAYDDIAEIKSTRAKRIEISSADPSKTIFLEVDGELPGKLPALYEIVPRALRVRIPA